MTEEATYSIDLAKEDFKFSSAHFTLFGEGQAEPLHGHNYRVRVRLVGRELDECGLLVDFASVKKTIRELCSRLDDRTLVPTESPQVQVAESEGQLRMTFSGRRYELPRNEAVLLPLTNTSVELLSRWFWKEIAPTLETSPLHSMRVEIEETDGQSASYSAPLGKRR